jgi:adenosylcobyric acid synthase
MAIALMILGTASSVGKSWVCTALCRSLARRGYRVAPFKAQNISNNAAPARMADGGWGEIGRAQALQALAAGCVPHVDMNPLLIKPNGTVGAQAVVLGQPQGDMSTLNHTQQRVLWRQTIHAAHDRLAGQYDVIVLEGAGSPAEINLQHRDLVNMSMAAHAISHARALGHVGGCLLVGDSSRGGVFASLYGTLALLPPEHRALIRGAIINRFHGDPRFLEPGPALFAARAGVPILGVLPDRPDIVLDEEDTLGEQPHRDGVLDIALIRLPTASNFTDFTALQDTPGVSVRTVTDNASLHNPDLILLPGAKDPLSDLRWLHRVGLADGIRAAADRQIPILGICGGYQLLGQWLDDPLGISGTPGRQPGLGLLPVHTTFSPAKQTREVQGKTRGNWLIPGGIPVRGYEIHHGETHSTAPPMLQLPAVPDGAVAAGVAGTYLHGILDSAPLRTALINALRHRRALPPLDGNLEDGDAFRQRNIDAAADVLDDRLDVDALLQG